MSGGSKTVCFRRAADDPDDSCGAAKTSFPATPVRKSLYQQSETREQLFQLPSPFGITLDKEVHSAIL